jgi:S1-C subfamily serine protease
MHPELKQLIIAFLLILLATGSALGVSVLPDVITFIQGEPNQELVLQPTPEDTKAILDETPSEETVEKEELPRAEQSTTTPQTEAEPIPQPDPAPVSIETPGVEITSETPTPEPENTTPLSSLQILNTTAREATVNILCTSLNPQVSSVTGSGVFIDAQGIILTNAHIGQNFLLKDYPQPNTVTCVIRNGSPALARYRAELLYISPSWISENRTAIRTTVPLGTGENDFAFLRVTETLTGVALPETFPTIPLSFDGDGSSLSATNEVLIAGYPAGFLGGSLILKNLNLVSTLTTITQVFTFNINTIDLFSTAGSILAQQGSSGGAVVSKEGSLVGIVVTATQEINTSERDLRAITIPYIDRALREEGVAGIADLREDPVTKASAFNQTIAPTLTNILISELQK